MDLLTHTHVNHDLCGNIMELEQDRAIVELETTEIMQVDAHHLIHGGFIFGLADYAAMCAVNHPNVVLGSSESKFIRPVLTHQTLRATAKVVKKNGKKRHVNVVVNSLGRIIFEGTFTCFILEQHVTTGAQSPHFLL
jgi:uncharacterized protein (TIGR00369 family)